MATFKDLLAKYEKQTSEENVIIFGTAMSDSAEGQVLVSFDDEYYGTAGDISTLTPGIQDPTEEGLLVNLLEDSDTVDNIDDDQEPQALEEEDETNFSLDTDSIGADYTPASEDDITDYD